MRRRRASSRPTAASAATGSSRSRAALDQIGPFARDARDAAALLHAIAGRDERDSTSAPVDVPDDLLRLPGLRRRGGLVAARASASGCRGSTSSPAWSRASRRAIREAVAALEAAGATVEEVSLPHTDYGLATYYIVAPAEASANLARYDGVRFGLQRARRRRLPRGLPRDPRPGLRRGGQAPDHARHVRAVGRLLRRVLPQGPEGPDADQARLRPPVGAGLRRPRRADVGRRSRSGSARGWPTRSRCTCPTPARCPSTWPGCPASRSRAACPRACRSASSSSAPPWSEARAVPRRARLRGDHRRRRLAAVEPPTSARSTTRPRRRPPSAPRAAGTAAVHG